MDHIELSKNSKKLPKFAILNHLMGISNVIQTTKDTKVFRNYLFNQSIHSTRASTVWRILLYEWKPAILKKKNLIIGILDLLL